MVRSRALALTSAATLFCATGAFAQPAQQSRGLKNLSLEELANVEITTATKQPEPVLNTPAAVHVITREDIRRSGATTLPDVLRLAPGLTVSQSDSNRWAVGVRGFADIFSKNVLVLIDGRSVYTPLVGGVHWAIQDVLLPDVDRIEVIRGPGGSVWGANAVNGVINIITRTAADTQGLRITGAAGSVEHGLVSARYGGGSGALQYRVHAKAFTRGPQYHASGPEFDDWNSVQGGFRADWRPTGIDTLTVSGDAYSTRVGERAEISTFTPVSSGFVDGTIDLTGGHVIVDWQRRLASGTRTRFHSYFDRTNRDGFTFGEVRNTWDSDFSIRFAPFGRHELTSGVNGRVSPSTITQRVPALAFVPPEHTHKVLSGFVHDSIALVRDRVSAGAGLKVEYNNYTGTELLPSAQVLWTPDSRQRLWGALTRAVRTPSRFERDLRLQVLIDPAAPVYVSLEGNQAFDAESVLGGELGYRRLVTNTLYVDVVVFDNQYDGLAGLGEPGVALAAAPIPHVRVTFPFANAVDGHSRGVEISPDWKPQPFWRLSGSYSYLHLSLRNRAGLTNPNFRDTYLGSSPTHQVRAQSRIDLGRGVEIDHTYRYVSALRAGPVPAYHSLDARVGWHPNTRLELAVVGQNLLAPRHAELGAASTQIRRSAYVQLTMFR